MIRRRLFLAGCGVIIIAAGLEPSLLLGSVENPHAGEGQTTDLTKSWFKAHLQEWFYFSDGSDTQQALLQLTELRDRSSASPVEQFTLVFRGRLGTQIAEGLYQVTSHTSGNFQLFLQPLGYNQSGEYFSAQFALLYDR